MFFYGKKLDGAHDAWVVSLGEDQGLPSALQVSELFAEDAFEIEHGVLAQCARKARQTRSGEKGPWRSRTPAA